MRYCFLSSGCLVSVRAIVAAPFAQLPGGAADGSPRAVWTKQNLAMHFEAVPRDGGFECDVNYRFSDDETFTSKKGKQDEN